MPIQILRTAANFKCARTRRTSGPAARLEDNLELVSRFDLIDDNFPKEYCDIPGK